MNGKILLLSGSPGAGKSSTARALAQRLNKVDKVVHLEIDVIRELVISGRADPIPWSDEAAHQFKIARQNAVFMAENYARHGFQVIMDDVVTDPQDYRQWLTSGTIYTVFLKPNKTTCLARNAARTNKAFDTALLAEFISGFTERIEATLDPTLWDRVLDTSALTLEQSVDLIIHLLDQHQTDKEGDPHDYSSPVRKS